MSWVPRKGHTRLDKVAKETKGRADSRGVGELSWVLRAFLEDKAPFERHDSLAEWPFVVKDDLGFALLDSASCPLRGCQLQDNEISKTIRQKMKRQKKLNLGNPFHHGPASGKQ